MKKIISLVLTLFISVSIIVTTTAADDITVTVNGSKVYFGETAPFIEKGRTLVPMRAIFEALGANVNWDGETQTIVSYNPDKDISITMTIGSNVMYIGERSIELDVPAKIVGSSTVVPVRAVAEGMECSVEWNEDTRTIIISRDANNVVIPQTYYNASAEVAQIASYINDGLYIEAMTAIEQTKKAYTLSPEDISLLDNLYNDANSKYNDYINSPNPVYMALLNSGTLNDVYDIIEDVAIIINKPTDYQRSLFTVTQKVVSDDDELDGDYIIIPHYAGSNIEIIKMHNDMNAGWGTFIKDYSYFNATSSGSYVVEFICCRPEIWPRSKITVMAPNGNVTECIPMYNRK